MGRLPQYRLALSATILTSCALAAAQPRSPIRKMPVAIEQSAETPDQTPLSGAQIHDLLARVGRNQHRDDQALDTFERMEHVVARNGGANGPVVSDKTFRLVPTGSGNLRLLVRQDGQPVTADVYRRQLRDWENILEIAINPNDPREASSMAKQQRKWKDRARLIDAVPSVFVIHWQAREDRGGRILDQLLFEPNPNYQPRGDSTDWLAHARATVWIDAQAAQIARVDAYVIRDISIGGGILGKVYHGTHFMMEQAAVAEDIWEPTSLQYDIAGRKFLFMFELHELATTGRYRLIGAPDKALDVARDDLARCCEIPADP